MGSVCEENFDRKISDESSSEENQVKKTCVDCGATKTPVWRGGPSGPKTLCNACGIRNRKKRMGHLSLGLNKSKNTKSSKRKNNNYDYDSIELRDSLKRRLLEMGSEVMMQRSMVDKEMRKLGEEEQAALLLMALSCGSIYA